MLASMFTSKWTWIGLGGLVLLIVALQFGGKVKSWWIQRDLRHAEQQAQAAQGEAAKAREALAAVQADAARMTQQIAVLRKAANAAVALAQAAEARAAKWQNEAGRLGSVVVALEADRRRLEPVRSLQEAQTEMRRAGYDLPLVTR